MICDLETGERLELLPDRDADQIADWLRNHPGVETIGRDRGDIDRKGATLGASQAIQVADRFHLINNLREAFSSCLDANQQSLRAALAKASTSCDED